MVKDILPRLISGCIPAVAPQAHQNPIIVVHFVDAGVQIFSCKFDRFRPHRSSVCAYRSIA